MKLPEWLTRKIGPLPAWGWLASAGAGLAIAQFRKGRAKPKETGEETATPTGSGGRVTPVTNAPAVNNALPYNGTTGLVTNGRTDVKSNDDWQVVAQRELVAKGYQPTNVAQALSDYIHGQPLDSQEQAIVDSAIIAIGPPPQPVVVGALPPRVHINTGSQGQSSTGGVEVDFHGSPLPPGVHNPSSGPIYGDPNFAGPHIGYVYNNRGTYTTHGGESGAEISMYVYGIPSRWGDIVSANPNQPGIHGSTMLPNITLWLPW